MNVNVTDVVFFSTELDEFNHVGVVMEVSGTDLVVHEYSTNLKLRSRWRPVWQKAGDLEVKKSCPSGYTPHLLGVSLKDVMLVGKMSGEVLSDNTKRRLLAKGFFWALPVGTPGSDVN